MSDKFDVHEVPIQFYIPRGDKEAFIRACRACDTTMARELRRFIRSFCENPPVATRNYYDLRPRSER